MLLEHSPLLFAAWVVWCALHSLLASRRVKRFLGCGSTFSSQRYRLGYVLFSIVTFITLQTWQAAVIRPAAPAGSFWLAVRLLCFAYAAAMFYGGGRAYDLKEFLGLAPPPVGPAGSPSPFRRTGILARVRHPWYSGTIALLIGIGNTPADRWDWRALLLAYLVIGCFIEERRLVAELGEVYRKYQREVPMLFPRPRGRSR